MTRKFLKRIKWADNYWMRSAMSILMNCVFCTGTSSTFPMAFNILLLKEIQTHGNSTALKYSILALRVFRKDFKQIQSFEHVLNTSPPREICFFLRITHIFKKM